MKAHAKIKGLAWLEKSTLSQLCQYLCKNKLTIIPKVNTTYADPNPIRLFANTDNWLGVPRGFLVQHENDREMFPDGVEYEIDLPTSYEQMSITDSSVVLRPHQQLAYDDLTSAMFSQVSQRGFFGGLLEAYTAFGKSLTSTVTCISQRERTIVFVHRLALADQWKEDINKFFPGLDVGIVGGGKKDWKNKDVVIAVMQTLYRMDKSKMGAEFFRNFGTVVVDEVHVTGAPMFASSIPNFESRRILGVSGTMRRADGCENVFKYLIGDVVHSATGDGRLHPLIWVRDTHFVPDYPVDHLEKPFLLNLLSEQKERTAMIAFDIFTAYKKKRHVLVLSERLKILNDLPMLVDHFCEKEGVVKPSHGFYIGKKKQAQLEEAAASDIVYASMQLAKEGIDIERLDFLALVTPVSDPEQAIGRICRTLKGKPKPVVADYVDFALVRPRAQYYKRLKLYRRLGWEVIEPKK